MNALNAQGYALNKMLDSRKQNEAYCYPIMNMSDSTYIVMENSGGDAQFYDSTYWTNGIRQLRIDLKGNVLNNDAHLFYHPYLSGGLIDIKNRDEEVNYRLIQLSYRGSLPSLEGFFEHYIGAVSFSGDSLWLSRLNVENDTNLIQSALKYHNFYYTFGTPTASVGPVGFLAKYDSSGNRIFSKTFKSDIEPMQLELIGVNRILMTGMHSYYGKDGILDHKPWFMITDTMCNVLFEKKYRDEPRNEKNVNGIHKISNNCYMMDGYKRYGVGNPTIFYLVDTMGKVSDERSIPLEYGTYDLVILDDKTFVAAGNDKIDSITVGKVIKADTAGNVIWQREYYTSYYESLFFGITKGLNNGFVITGAGIDTTKLIGRQDAWLIVTDSLGCVTPGCQLINNVQEIPKQKLEYLHCWPNPVNDLLHCKLHPTLNTIDCALLIIDENGKEILKMNPMENNCDVNLSGQSPGFYYVMLLKNNRLLAGSKIIKL